MFCVLQSVYYPEIWFDSRVVYGCSNNRLEKKTKHKTNGTPPAHYTYVVNILIGTTDTTKCNTLRSDWRRN